MILDLKDFKVNQNISQKTEVVLSASAGSGKTFSLRTFMLGFLGQEYCRPHEIMAISYTKKSANDLKNQLLNITRFAAEISVADWKDLLQCFSPLKNDLAEIAQTFTSWDKACEEKKNAWIENHGGDPTFVAIVESFRLSARQWCVNYPSNPPQWMCNATSARVFWKGIYLECLTLPVSTLHSAALRITQNESKILDTDDPQFLQLIKMIGTKEWIPDVDATEIDDILLEWAGGGGVHTYKTTGWEKLTKLADELNSADISLPESGLVGMDEKKDALVKCQEALFCQWKKMQEAHEQDTIKKYPAELSIRTWTNTPPKKLYTKGYPQEDFWKQEPSDYPIHIYQLIEQWSEALFELNEGQLNQDRYKLKLKPCLDGDSTINREFQKALKAWATAAEDLINSKIFHVLQLFDEAKRKRQFVTFGDISKEACSLDSNQIPQPKLLLIDEFQDLNNTDLKFVEKLRGVGTKLIIAGDVKQAIYGFRGGNSKHLESKINFPAEGKSVYSLGTNYRSHGNIVRLSNYLVSNIYKKLKLNNQPIITYPSPPQEIPQETKLESISENSISIGVTKSTNNHSNGEDWAPWLIEEVGRRGDITLLVRTRKHVPKLVERLRKEGIEPIIDAEKGRKKSEIYRLLISLLGLYAEPSNLIHLYSVLRSPWVHLNDQELVCVAEKIKLKTEDKSWMLFSTYRLLNITLETIGTEHPSAKSVKWLLDLNKKNTATILSEAIAHRSCNDEGGLLEFFHTKLGSYNCLEPERARRNAEEYLNTSLNLSSSPAIAYYQLVGQPDRGPALIETSGVNRLLIATVHSAKGLEYNNVVVSLIHKLKLKMENPNYGDGEGTRGKIGWKFGKNLIGENGIAIAGERLSRNIKEELNLLYVAITRAKDHLLLLQQNFWTKWFEATPTRTNTVEQKIYERIKDRGGDTSRIKNLGVQRKLQNGKEKYRLRERPQPIFQDDEGNELENVQPSLQFEWGRIVEELRKSQEQTGKEEENVAITEKDEPPKPSTKLSIGKELEKVKNTEERRQLLTDKPNDLQSLTSTVDSKKDNTYLVEEFEIARREGIAFHLLIQELLMLDPAERDQWLNQSPLVHEFPGNAPNDDGIRYKTTVCLEKLNEQGWLGRPRRTEFPIEGSGQDGGMGKADLVMWYPNRSNPTEIIVVDYKRSLPSDRETEEKYRQQVTRYVTKIQEKYHQEGKQVVVKGYLYNVEDGSLHEIDS